MIILNTEKARIHHPKGAEAVAVGSDRVRAYGKTSLGSAAVSF